MLTLCAIQWAELRRLVGQMWPSGREFNSSGDSYNTGLIVCQERFSPNRAQFMNKNKTINESGRTVWGNPEFLDWSCSKTHQQQQPGSMLLIQDLLPVQTQAQKSVNGVRA